MQYSRLFSLLLPVCSLAIACTGTDDGGTDAGAEEESHEDQINEEGCEHMAEGPSESVTATASLEGTQTDISTAHTRFDISLVEDNGQYKGFVTYDASEEGELFLFLNANIPTQVSRLSDGSAVEIEETDEAFSLCDAVSVLHVLDVEIGTLAIEFGPTSETEVHAVAELLTGEHDHDGHDE
jgi:hypothetical protein